jgi:hypothetical protein
VHRDIKPENVMVREDGFVKILDFGLAQHLREQPTGAASLSLPVGTARYMSPEQKAGRPATTASDIYSLAVVLEEAGWWKHPILSRMRVPEPERRPTAREVERVLAELDAPSHHRLVAALLVCVTLLIGSAVYWKVSERRRGAERFVQITHYSSGHDIAVAAISPDGSRMAYATIDGGFFVRDQGTGHVVEVIGPEPFTCYQIFFTGDEQLLAIGLADKRFEAWQIPVGQRAPRRLAADVQMAAVSHSGKQVAWLDGSHRVWAGARPGGPARLLFQVSQRTHVADLFWSGDDKQVWYRRVRGCHEDADKPDVLVNPSSCAMSELVSGPSPAQDAISIGPLFFNSGFFASSGAFYFLRQDVAGRDEGYNVWRLPVDRATGHLSSRPVQVTHLSSVGLFFLTGTANGKRLTMVRSDYATHTYVGEWSAKPTPSLVSPRRLTIEENNTYAHAWSADNQWVIFESDQTGNLELFRQKRNRREPQRLTYSKRENYMAQLTPDGKSILFMSSTENQQRGFTDLRLMRIPAEGGPMVPVTIAGAWDEFRCGRFGQSHNCVLRASAGREQIYYELDPIAGKGPELGRTTTLTAGFGAWALSANGELVAVPDSRHPGCFTEIRLDAKPSKRWQVSKQVVGIGTIHGMSPGALKGEWLLSSSPGNRASDQLVLPPYFVENSRFYFIDSQLHPHLLENNGDTSRYGVFSNDGKYVAIVRAEQTRNVWSFDR